MRLYETIFILRPDLTEEEAEATGGDIQAELDRLNFEVLQVDTWGKKRLAYAVKKQKYGYYTLIYFQGEPDQISRLERFYRINEQVMKSIVVRVEREREVRAMLAEKKEPDQSKPPETTLDDKAGDETDASTSEAAATASVDANNGVAESESPEESS